MDWREDHRRISNGEQYGKVVKAALAHPFPKIEKLLQRRRKMSERTY